jgi:hypothetical protein
MKKSKKKFISVIMSKTTLTPASAKHSIPKVVLKVDSAGMGQ